MPRLRRVAARAWRDDPVNILDVGVAVVGEQQQVLLDGRRRDARQAGAVAGELGERHVGGGGTAERQQGADVRVGRDLAPRDGVGEQQRREGLGDRADLVHRVAICAEMGVRDGSAVDGRDTDPVECPGQMRERPSGECRSRQSPSVESDGGWGRASTPIRATLAASMTATATVARRGAAAVAVISGSFPGFRASRCRVAFGYRKRTSARSLHCRSSVVRVRDVACGWDGPRLMPLCSSCERPATKLHGRDGAGRRPWPAPTPCATRGARAPPWCVPARWPGRGGAARAERRLPGGSACGSAARRGRPASPPGADLPRRGGRRPR